MNKKEKIYDIGVIIGRFQIDELHTEHKKVIDEVLRRHEKVILFIGVTSGLGTERNPLDFLTRKVMIEEIYNNKISLIYPLNDKKLDEVWSKQVDTKIREAFPLGSVVLYGSKDSFIPHYKGKFDVIELVPENTISATDIRKQISKKVESGSDFRKGIIYSCYNRHPAVQPTIDVAIMNEDETQVLLGRKHQEIQFRFIGGFVDVTDGSYEQTARREAGEETGLDIGNIVYIGSVRVNDWRYKSDTDRSIMTTFFKAKKISGHEKGADDIAEVKWFNVADLKAEELVPEHTNLVIKLKEVLSIN